MVTSKDDLTQLGEALHRGFKAEVARLRASLESWIDQNQTRHPSTALSPNDIEVDFALLETAIDRVIRLQGIVNAHEFVQTCFQRRAEQHLNSLR